MVAGGTISQNVFSFYLTSGADSAATSYIDFGEPDTDAMKSGNEIVWISVIDD